MSARLIYVMDPMCSWCWGFEPVLQHLASQAERAGVGLQLVVGGLRRECEVMDPGGRERTLGYWRSVRESTGQSFNFETGLPPGLVYDTEPACRALVVARGMDAGSAWPLARRLQQAFYQEGQDITRAQVLLELATRQGLCRETFASRFDGLEAREETQRDFAWAQNLGIAGFPTLLARRQGGYALLTNGYQSAEVLGPLLGRWLEQGSYA
ncbi:DsbA family protein [Stutzerimonas kirkiae]|uniref:Disulfide bond formation protein DsbA n=1 Tax=Stutzerimonas kirkiae TaxID=2211392 RepID=A0A4V2KDK3_9GAMM|nr:DsbA family protein [Stutzerimonas kirkiae]TBV00060.1 disulfide bond formation protein DsbA [Stutzerimonas kirkiae]TBV05766.1 disulfide bond formation protein DsbA [Stutzerimonas kirkiae]TBV09561.1 disulfide bond formation protein DsbA [Stutzerimonas kirkiae]TBV17357.1 disulfide bond formation protein DsbA [Stutzerimonas kirkiae]